MRVCLDISAALSGSAGIGRYARELAVALADMPQLVDLSLFHNRQPAEILPAALRSLPRSVVPLGNKQWRGFLLTGLPLRAAWSAASDRADVFHGTDFVTPALRRPCVITIHDLTTLLFPRFHARLNALYQRVALPIMCRRARRIIADSESTRRDIVGQLNVVDEVVRVVHPGIDHRLFRPKGVENARARISAQLNLRGPYVLALGTLEPRKNLANLLRAYSRLDASAPRLVLAGGKGWGDGTMLAIARAGGIAERVTFTGFVPDELLPDLYEAAEAFVYPSYYEGFGFPILEAMACKTPVITSNVSSMPEVAGDAALLVSPTRVDELEDALRRMLADGNLRRALSEQGLKRAKTFTWQRTAQQTLQVYREALA